VGLVAQSLERRYVGIELNPEYVSLAAGRIGLEEPKVIRVAA
jgi:site-specific DNA-methyltransferase (adenine-specific)